MSAATQIAVRLLIVALAASSCSTLAVSTPCKRGAGAPAPTHSTTARAEARYDSIVVAIEAPAAACLDTPLRMRFVLRNVAGRVITLTNTDTAFFAQFEVQDASGVRLWDSGPTIYSPTSQALAAGDSLTYATNWAFGTARLAPVTAGRYRLVGRAMLEGGNWPETPPALFTIHAPAGVTK